MGTFFSLARHIAVFPIVQVLRSQELRGKGGVPWVQIMENELECLGDRTGHDVHLTKKFLKKDYS